MTLGKIHPNRHIWCTSTLWNMILSSWLNQHKLVLVCRPVTDYWVYSMTIRVISWICNRIFFFRCYMIQGNFDQGEGTSSKHKENTLNKRKGWRMTPQTSNCLMFSERLNMNFFSINWLVWVRVNSVEIVWARQKCFISEGLIGPTKLTNFFHFIVYPTPLSAGINISPFLSAVSKSHSFMSLLAFSDR